VTRNDDSGDIREVLAALWRRKFVVLGTLVVLLGVAVAVASVQTAVYQSSAAVLVRPPTTSPLDTSNSTSQDRDRMVRNERDFLKSDAVRSAVLQRFGPHKTITVTSVAGSDVIDVKVQADSAQMAADLANAYAATYLEQRRVDWGNQLTQNRQAVEAHMAEVDRQISTVPDDTAHASQRTALSALRQRYQQTIGDLSMQADAVQVSGPGRVVRTAVVPAHPSKPNLSHYVIIAVLAGVIGGAALALLRDSFDRTVRLSRADKPLSGLPTLAVIPALSRKERHAVAAGGSPAGSSLVEAYRSLRALIETAAQGQSVRVIQVVSPQDTAKTAETVRDLGIAFHAAGHRVLLVSADLRTARLSTLCGQTDGQGLTSVVLNGSPLSSAVRPVRGVPQLLVLPSGPAPANPGDLLASKETVEIFEQLREIAELVIVESAPIVPFADSLEVAKLADATLLVTVEGKTGLTDIERSVQLLDGVGARWLGTVIHSRRGAKIRPS
jgi:capsular exopolysaccharide synthesis family protein